MNSMADNQKVYQEIKTIADELCKENKTYLRADLAFELKKYGIASDSSEVLKTEDIHPPKTGISVHFSGSLV